MQVSYRPEADAWLKEEMSRPYWKKDFKVELQDDGGSPESEAKEIEVMKQERLGAETKRLAAFKDVKELVLKKGKTAEEIQSLLEKMAALLMGENK